MENISPVDTVLSYYFFPFVGHIRIYLDFEKVLNMLKKVFDRLKRVNLIKQKVKCTIVELLVLFLPFLII